MDDADLSRIAVMIGAAEKRITNTVLGCAYGLVFGLLFLTGKLDGFWLVVAIVAAAVYGLVMFLRRRS